MCVFGRQHAAVARPFSASKPLAPAAALCSPAPTSTAKVPAGMSSCRPRCLAAPPSLP